MAGAKKSRVKAAEDFLRNAIEARKVSDTLESFGKEDLPKVVRMAATLGYKFGIKDLEAALDKNWGDDCIYVNRFCISEPPGF